MARARNISSQTRGVLAILAAQSGAWRHGYEISRLTGVKSGTLYPLLTRLHEQGLLEASWVLSPQAGRPPRHIYRLTRRGLSVARHMSVAFPPFNPTKAD